MSADATFIQTADLDLSSCGSWPGIGGGWDGNNATNPFTGTYDGGGRSITNLTINWTTGQGAGWGLFRTASGATFQNLTLSNVTISTTSHEEFNVVGSLIGLASDVTISAVTVSATSIAATNNLGGLVGFVIAPATLSDITGNATITGAWGSSNNAGGLIGAIPAVSASVTITNLNATGPVSGFNAVGGLIGAISASIDLTNSFATGNVTGHASVGGLIGGLVGTQIAALSPFNISHSYATGNVTGTHNVGGFFGAHEAYRPGTLHNLYARGSVTASENAGGLVGWLRQYSSVTNSYATGAVTRSGGSASSVGGLIGLRDENATVSASFWDTSTSGQTVGVGAVSGGGGASDITGGVTTSALQSLSTFHDAGWSITAGDQNLTSIWGICDGASYPYLSWQTQRASWTPAATPCQSDNDNDNNGNGNDTPPDNGVTPSQPDTSPDPSTTTPVVTSPPVVNAPTPLPVTNGGVLPVLAPGTSQVLIDGEPEIVNVFVDNATDLVISGNGFELRMAGQCTLACPITTNSDGREVLTFEREGSTRLDGTGFMVDTPVYVWLFSEPHFLGELTVNSDGGFSGVLPLGDIAEGVHTLQVNGMSADGKLRTANIGVQVIPQQTAPSSLTLPTAGGTISTLWVWALGLLYLGLVATSRRRAAR